MSAELDSPVGGDVVETAAGSAAAERTGVIPSNADSGSGQNDSGQLRAEAVKLARLLDPVAFGDLPKPHNAGQSFDQVRRQQVALDNAMIALVHGYRMVAVDDATVERVARAIWASKWRVPDATDRAWERAKSRTTEHHVAARTAVQALRDGSGT